MYHPLVHVYDEQGEVVDIYIVPSIVCTLEELKRAEKLQNQDYEQNGYSWRFSFRPISIYEERLNRHIETKGWWWRTYAKGRKP